MGGEKVACILHHWGVQLILDYIWARAAVLVAGKDRGGLFFFFVFFLFLHFHSCSSFFPVPLYHFFYHLFYLFHPFSGRRLKMTNKGLCVVKPKHNQNPLPKLRDEKVNVKMRLRCNLI